MDQAAWRRSRRRGTASVRPATLKVVELADHAASSSTTRTTEQLLDLEQVFELLSLRANLTVCREIARAVVGLLNPSRNKAEVVSGAALVTWKLCEHKPFLVRLVQRGLPPSCCTSRWCTSRRRLPPARAAALPNLAQRPPAAASKGR